MLKTNMSLEKLQPVVLLVLKGKKVKDIPVDVIDDGTPTLNLKVARDLNITIPDDVLKQSDIAVKADK